MHETRIRTRTIALLAAASLFSGGCATVHRVQVDAVKNAGITGEVQRTSYRLLNANPELSDDDPAIQATMTLVRTALSSKGLFEAPAGVEPDLEIEVDCSVSNAQRRIEVVTVPVYQERPFAGDDWGAASFERVGEQTRRIMTVVYEKQLRISAREAAARAGGLQAPAREVWSVVATSVDGEPDLGRCTPFLVAAAMDEFDSDSVEPRDVRVTRGDSRVAFVCAGL